MSDVKPVAGSAVDFVDVDIRAWVEEARANPAAYRDRQVTEIVLTAIGMAPRLSDALVLKGGTLMGLAFDSLRLTGDVDFSADADPEGFEDIFSNDLNALLSPTALKLGYLDLVCRVQSVRKMPRPENFAEHDFPALGIKIASAVRGTAEQGRLDAGLASRVLDVEISFKDKVYASQDLRLTGAGVAVRAFTLHELVAEKLRALLQQPIRKRYRRQDVFDIAFLIEHHDLQSADLETIHRTLLEKCASRSIYPDATSLDDPEVVRRAEADWDTLKLEISDLPAFENRFTLVRSLYAALPWAVANEAAP
ncbi:nucleotidyl transferase AbiEii/AbiGii toxin family protein [Brevundimonas sp.]|uniref:nucleotidyl transferase AbiEii/AbiGii toxin family protein n=1 Tax=Brevundimonas sp. TaxID=1871086 RepID=UPI00286C213B|nr:nucleotidyl transferase AbiEii/AbiGii toxin family protein [Brevundimonas sp.]